MARPVDVVVIGAGPAGCAAALLLARYGYRVRMFERRALPRPQIGESLPPKILGLLSILGVREAVETAGFVRMAATTVGQGDAPATYPFAPYGFARCGAEDLDATGLGFQVERARFDGILQKAAEAAGVEVVTETPVRDLLLDDARSGVRGVVLGLGRQGGPAEVPARFVVDASGRRALSAHRRGEHRRDAVRTLAATTYYAKCRLPDDFSATDTVFEMLRDGWIWSVLRSDGLRNVTLGLDSRAIQARAGPVQELFETRVRTSALVGALIEHAERVTELSVTNATETTSDRYAQPGLLRAGDAASTIDPLTSQGVYKALQSGITAAAVVNTCLRRPDDRRLALSYYDQQERDLARNYRMIARAFYRASPHAHRPFWRERIGPLDALEGIEDDVWSTARAARRARFVRSLAAHGADALHVQPQRGVELRRRPGVSGGFVVVRPALVRGSRAWQSPTLDVERLWSLIDGRPMSALFDEYARAVGQAPSSGLGRQLRSALAALICDQFVEVNPMKRA